MYLAFYGSGTLVTESSRDLWKDLPGGEKIILLLLLNKGVLLWIEEPGPENLRCRDCINWMCRENDKGGNLDFQFWALAAHDPIANAALAHPAFEELHVIAEEALAPRPEDQAQPDRECRSHEVRLHLRHGRRLASLDHGRGHPAARAEGQIPTLHRRG